MDKWLLNTKKIKLALSTCDTDDTEETQSCTNELGTSGACPTVLQKMMMDILQSTGRKISGVMSLIPANG